MPFASKDEMRRMRQEAGLSQQALAAALTKVRGSEVHQTYVSRVELGKTSAKVDELEEWAEACGYSVEVRINRPGADHDPLVAELARLARYAPPHILRGFVLALREFAEAHLQRAVR